MTLPCGLPARLSEAVEIYVGWRGNGRPVSLKRLVKATSFMMPELGLTDHELSELIARKLVSMGCNINFDMTDVENALPGAEVSPGATTAPAKTRKDRRAAP